MDYCHKYAEGRQDIHTLDLFNEKLKQKSQLQGERNSARVAIELYLGSIDEGGPVEYGKSSVEEQQSSSMRPPKSYLKTTEINTTPTEKNVGKNERKGAEGASWRAEYEGFDGTIRMSHYSSKTYRSYKKYVPDFQAYTRSVEPDLLSSEHVKRFLNHLAVEKPVSASTQNLAFNSLLFFYRHVLGKEFGQIDGVVRAKNRPYIPVVLSRNEVEMVFAAVVDEYKLVLQLLCGCGLRLF